MGCTASPLPPSPIPQVNHTFAGMSKHDPNPFQPGSVHVA